MYNPVSSIATLNIDKSLIGSNYTITNQFGNIMQTGVLITTMQTIDVHTFASGIYYFNTINTETTLIKPICIAIIR